MGNNGYGLGATFKRVFKFHLLLLPSCHLLKTAFVRSSHMTRILELHKAIPRCCSTVKAARAVNSKQGWTQALARTVNMCAIGQVTLIMTWSCYQFEIMQAFMASNSHEGAQAEAESEHASPPQGCASNWALSMASSTD